MRIYHIGLFVVCMNFSLMIIAGTGLFHGAVPTAAAPSQYESYGTSPFGLDLVAIITSAGVGLLGVALLRLVGLQVPLGAILFGSVFSASVYGLWAVLNNFASSVGHYIPDPANPALLKFVSDWPVALNVGILGLVGLIFAVSIVQLSSTGFKGAE